MLGTLAVPRRRLLLLAPVALLVALAVVLVVLVVLPPERATGSYAERCERFAADAAARAAVVTGSGTPVLVVGDSWSAGLGLADPSASWPARLDGRVHVAGFSGSGFSARASGCGDVSFAARAPQALAGLPAGTLVVVEGGLNDWDRSDVEISTGFEDLLAAVAGHRLVVVGPANAPSRAAYVDRVDALLAELSARHDVGYLSALDVDLDYLDDRLHLTPAGHAAFGDWVAARLRGATRP
ncbi:SGNH/GDSL hydrolase family protein [Nocardioides sp. SOB44]|uniref:SGNH/GDSL hydrolase family protein n=1 Tax=Nocardioides cremeus TaxID=3058044 RepID=A0ABT8TVQ4_9ACTN|nr:SGNH/GDSL hydrolase family protein [Nocardioides cremeus]MDO3396437.1 SGNH/GDSL hydrolase family protein [Nocardioides cremeus]